MNGLTVIIPVKPPEPYLPELVKEIHKVLRDIDHEVLMQTEVGLTNAVIQGVKKSQYNTIVVIDADGSHNPKYLPEMHCLLTKFDLVIGSKFLGYDDNPFIRRFISKIFCWFASSLLDLPVKEVMSGFVMGRKQCFICLKPSTDYKFLLQIFVYNPILKVKEFPIDFRQRQKGMSKASLQTGLRTLLSIIHLWIKTLNMKKDWLKKTGEYYVQDATGEVYQKDHEEAGW